MCASQQRPIAESSGQFDMDTGLNCHYNIAKNIVWDEPKRLANIARHGMDFVDLDEAFFEGSVIVPAKSAA
jgi:hypothetical protein